MGLLDEMVKDGAVAIFPMQDATFPILDVAHGHLSAGNGGSPSLGPIPPPFRPTISAAATVNINGSNPFQASPYNQPLSASSPSESSIWGGPINAGPTTQGGYEVDLGSQVAIGGYEIDGPFDGETTTGTSFYFQWSTDRALWTTVATWVNTGNGSGGWTAPPRIATFGTPITSRYWRIVGNGSAQRIGTTKFWLFAPTSIVQALLPGSQGVLHIPAGSCVVLPDSIYDAGQNYTFEFMVMWPTTLGSSGTMNSIIGKDQDGGNIGGLLGFQGSGPGMVLSMVSKSGGQSYAQIVWQPPAFGVAYHIVWAVDAVGNNSLYVNGVYIGTAVFGNRNNSVDFRIGQPADGFWGCSDFYMSHLAVYTIAMGAKRAAAHYRAMLAEGQVLG